MVKKVSIPPPVFGSIRYFYEVIDVLPKLMMYSSASLYSPLHRRERADQQAAHEPGAHAGSQADANLLSFSTFFFPFVLFPSFLLLFYLLLICMPKRVFGISKHGCWGLSGVFQASGGGGHYGKFKFSLGEVFI